MSIKETEKLLDDLFANSQKITIDQRNFFLQTTTGKKLIRNLDTYICYLGNLLAGTSGWEEEEDDEPDLSYLNPDEDSPYIKLYGHPFTRTIKELDNLIHEIKLNKKSVIEDLSTNTGHNLLKKLTDIVKSCATHIQSFQIR